MRLRQVRHPSFPKQSLRKRHFPFPRLIKKNKNKIRHETHCPTQKEKKRESSQVHISFKTYQIRVIIGSTETDLKRAFRQYKELQNPKDGSKDIAIASFSYKRLVWPSIYMSKPSQTIFHDFFFDLLKQPMDFLLHTHSCFALSCKFTYHLSMCISAATCKLASFHFLIPSVQLHTRSQVQISS